MKLAVKNQLMRSMDYVAFLAQALEERGEKGQLAEVAGCQPAYLSQVLAGRAHLTPEHAERISTHWDLDALESEYFFNLVLLARAGTASLRARLTAKLKDLRREWSRRGETFAKPSLSAADRALIYYSDWLVSAVHMLLTMPRVKTAEAVAERLDVEPARVLTACHQLEKIGLITAVDKGWRVTDASVHAPDPSVESEMHHRNWRLHSLQHSEHRSVRYTSVHTLSLADFQKITDVLDAAIQRTREIIEPSREDVAACLIMDYFRLS